MKKIAIITDSTANFPAAWAAQYGIKSIPLKIHWGDETFRDGIDMTPGEFYGRLKGSKTLPTTSQPSPEDFLQAFEGVPEGIEGIVVPLISSGISGTVNSALTAASQFKRLPVEVIDSRITSMGLVAVILAAARAAEAGNSLQEVKEAAEKVVQGQHTFFAVDTLEYLHRGGRINTASRFFGTALEIKPILFFNEEGKIDALERVRTKKKALQRLISLVEEQAKGRPVRLGICHANTPQETLKFRDEVVQRLDCREDFIVELSPVIGIHVGPGAIGISIYQEE